MVPVEFFDPNDPGKATSPALIFGYQMLLSMGTPQGSGLLSVQTEVIEQELRKRGLLASARVMLEEDKQQARALKLSAPKPPPFEPRRMSAEQLFFAEASWQVELVRAKTHGNIESVELALERLTALNEELEARQLLNLLTHIRDLDKQRKVARVSN